MAVPPLWRCRNACTGGAAQHGTHSSKLSEGEGGQVARSPAPLLRIRVEKPVCATSFH